MSKICIVITVYPASGKTKLGQFVSCELGIPIFHRDGIKENIYDEIQSLNNEIVKDLGQISYSILYYMMEQMMITGNHIIVESNFNKEKSSPILLNLINKYNYIPVVIRLHADKEVLCKRFIIRDENDRHPVHINKSISCEDFIAASSKHLSDEIDLNGICIDIDTTDFSKVNYENIVNELKNIIKKKEIDDFVNLTK